MTRRRPQRRTIEDGKRIVEEAWRRRYDGTGYPPTTRDLCHETGYRSTSTVSRYLRQLIEDGRVPAITPRIACAQYRQEIATLQQENEALRSASHG